jgi:hypothetical protein
MRLLQPAVRFLRLPLREKCLLAEAGFYLLVCTVMIHWVPFRYWEQRIGRKMQPLEEPALPPGQMKQVAEVRRAVRRANKLLMGLGKCFAISLTLKKMLNKRGIGSTLYLGVRKGEPDSLLAHAWLKCGRITVYGGREAAKHYRELVVYT